MPEADAEDRHLAQQLGQLGDDRAGFLRIARAVRQEHAIGLHGQHLAGRSVGGHDRDRGQLTEMPQHGGLHTEVVGDDLPRPVTHHVRLIGGDDADEVDAGRTGFGFGRRAKSRLVGRAERTRHGAGIPDVACQPAGVDPGDPRHPVAPQEALQVTLTAPVAVAPGEIPDDDAATKRAGGLVVGGVDPVVPDVGIGEGDDLACIGRIGDHLLVAGEDGVEHHLTGGDSVGRVGTDPLPFEHLAIGQHQLVLTDAHRCASPSLTTTSPFRIVCRTLPRTSRPS